jgi:hypothetical protein
LQEAVLALKAFQNEEWPAKNKNSGVGQGIAVPEVETDDQETVATQETEETGMEKADTSAISSEIAPIEMIISQGITYI